MEETIEIIENIQRTSSISFPFLGDWTINPPRVFHNLRQKHIHVRHCYSCRIFAGNSLVF